MEYEKELIQAKIDQIKDPIQKILLKDVLKTVFTQLTDYSNKCISDIKRQLETEIEPIDQKFGICTAICSRDSLKEGSPYWNEIEGESSTLPDGFLRTIFIEASYQEIGRCMGEVFEAKVTTDQNTYFVKLTVNYAKRYQDAVEWLYTVFIANKRRWNTVNCPYLYKFIDLIDFNHVIPEGESVQKIELELHGLEQKIRPELVLVWNVSHIIKQANGEAVPGSQAVLYGHRIKLPVHEFAYLVIPEAAMDFYCVIEEEAIVVRVNGRAYEELELLQVNSFDEELTEKNLLFPVKGNLGSLRFSDRQASLSNFIVTKGNIRRFLSIYEEYQQFELEQAEIKEKTEVRGIDCNAFIPSHQFLGKRRYLVLHFHVKTQEHFLLYEDMLYLVSQLQLLTEEYICVGELLTV